MKMPVRAAVLIVLLAATAVPAQEFERTIYLPDSNSGLTWPTICTYNATDDVFYVGSEYGSCVLAIDAATGKRLARIPTGDECQGLCWHPGLNRVYYAGYAKYRITVIDCRTNTVITHIPVPNVPTAMVIHPGLNKLYCQTDADTNSMVVIDCATNQVCATLPPPEPYYYEALHPSLACDTINDKTYAQVDDPLPVALYAIDCHTDTVCARIELGDVDVYSFFWEPVLNRIYCAVDTDVYTKLYVIDCTTDSIVNTIPFAGDAPTPTAICANPTGTRIYAWDDGNGELEVFDVIAGRSVMRERLGDGWGTLCYNPTSSKLYLAMEDANKVVVFDPDDTWAADVPVGISPQALACSPRSNTILCVNEDARVDLIDGAGDSIRHSVRTALELTDIAVNEREGKLYALDLFGILAIIDEASGQVLRQVDVSRGVSGGGWSGLLLHENRNKLYCVRSHEIAVVDCAADTVVVRIEIDGRTPIACLSAIADRLYVATPREYIITIIDCTTDRLVRTITASHRVRALCCDSAGQAWFSAGGTHDGIIGSIAGDTATASIFVPGERRAICYNPVNDRVYAAVNDSRVVVDPVRKSIIDTIDLESGELAQRLCINTINNKLYAQTAIPLAIVDCTSDSVLTHLPAGLRYAALLYEPDANHLYYTYDTMLVVVDGTADTIIARFSVTRSWAGLAFSRASHRLYHAGYSEIVVFHCPPPTHAAIGETGPTLISREITLLGTNPADLIDVTGRRVLRLTPGPNRLHTLPAGVYYLHRPIDRYTQKVILRP
jgi:DNA-binding beta-propeller fold protein YncE